MTSLKPSKAGRVVKVNVISGGWSTTVQDFGRPGWGRYGIPVSGAMDPCAMILANRRAGNSDQAPVLEAMGYLGTLEFLNEAVVGLASPGLKVSLNGADYSDTPVLEVRAGDIITVRCLPPGMSVCLSVSGRLVCEEWLGSFSTCLPARRGGLCGRRIRKGDVLTWVPVEGDIRKAEIGVGCDSEMQGFDGHIRILPGPEWEAIGHEPRRALLAEVFQLSPQLDRTAIRLEAPIGLSRSVGSILSSPVLPGVIQWPPGGKPIVVMNDGQTIGGYPRVAAVHSQDLRKLAHGRPGQTVRFVLEEE